MIKKNDFGSKYLIHLRCLLSSPKANYKISTSKETKYTKTNRDNTIQLVSVRQ
jgi:hypothetical protein